LLLASAPYYLLENLSQLLINGYIMMNADVSAKERNSFPVLVLYHVHGSNYNIRVPLLRKDQESWTDQSLSRDSIAGFND
jgi:hypothetical protein